MDKAELLKENQEWSIRGGKKLGDKYLSFLDLDIKKEEIAKSLQEQLGKNASLLLDYLNCFHVKTKKGYHAYLLTDELLPNQLLYHTDKFGNRRIIGSIQSKGKYVVGFDSRDKELVEMGKWFWHDKGLVGIKAKLEKFFVEVGDDKKQATENEFLELQRKVKEAQTKNITPLTSLTPNIKCGQSKPEQAWVRVKLLGKQKIPLPYLWKMFYFDWKTKQKSYFLVNDYHRERAFNDLEIGNALNICLVRGYKHSFLNRIIPQNNYIQPNSRTYHTTQNIIYA